MVVAVEVWVAGVAALPATVAAAAAWKAARQTKANGQGTLPQMTERLLADMQELKVVSNHTLRRLVEHEVTTDAHEARAVIQQVQRDAHQAAQEARWGDEDTNGYTDLPPGGSGA